MFQLTCDSDLIFLDVNSGYPGSSHDAFLIRQCAIYPEFEHGEYGDYIVMGDSAYGLKTWLFTPLQHPSKSLVTVWFCKLKGLRIGLRIFLFSLGIHVQVDISVFGYREI